MTIVSSFPTRRSSDLVLLVGLLRAGFVRRHVVPFLAVVTLAAAAGLGIRSEEHTSELQSQSNLVCRLVLEKINEREAVLKRVRDDDRLLVRGGLELGT